MILGGMYCKYGEKTETIGLILDKISDKSFS